MPPSTISQRFALPALVVFICSMAVFLGGTGCENAFVANDQARRLIALAAEESAQIQNARERLRRQLNIADDQINNGQATDARATLTGAAQTLLSARGSRPATAPVDGAADDSHTLDDRTRLAGWVSISELSRQAGDSRGANEAIGRAVELLHQIEPTTQRVQYVHSIGEELRELRGKQAAAGLLVEGGQWAGEIDDVARRRSALTAIAQDLFRADDFTAGRDVLRRDPDAAWRADTLEALGRQAAWQAHATGFGSFASGVTSAKMSAEPGFSAPHDERTPAGSESVDLSYKANFARPR